MKRNKKQFILATLAVAAAMAFAPLVPTTLAQGDDQPDLIPTTIAIDPGEPQAGDLVTFTAVVANEGNASAGPFTVEFAVDDTLVSAEAVTGVDADSTTNVTSDPWPATQGDHTVTVTVDTQGTVDEENEDNNALDRDFSILADLVTTDFEPQPEAPSAGDDVTFNATVSNQGDAPVQEFNVAFAVDDEEIANVTVAGPLEPGDSVTVDSQEAWNASLGTHLGIATADPSDNVDEENETNNHATLDLGIGANLLVVDIEPIPAATEAGDQAVFSATVPNDGHEATGEFRVGFTLGDEDLGAAIVSNLDDGDTTTVTSQAWVAQEGVHTLTVVADSDDQVNETDETDNERSRTIPVGEENLPNLVVRGAEHDPSVPTTNETVSFEATVTNEGGSEASPFAVNFALDAQGQIDQAVVAGGLEPGETATLSADPVTLETTGQHQLSVTADPAGAVPEATTGDNQAVHTFTVVEPGESGLESPTPTEGVPTIGAVLAAAAVAAGLALARRR